MRHLSCSGLALLLGVGVSHSARGATLSVGPQGEFAAPCAAFAAAADGDTIEIDSAGSYRGDVCGIAKSRLSIRGIAGRAVIDAAGKNAQGKAIWVVQGDDTSIESIEFSGAAVPDANGAGIRQEGKNLTVRHCYFHDNENGILAGDSPGSEILIEHSEFEHNGAGDGYSHNLYVNHVAKLTFRYNWSHDAVIGHLLKSRAAENYVLYNRLTGEADGTSSYELDFPNGGKTYVIGNLIEQGPMSDNPSLLAYIEEGAAATNPSHQLYVVNNTFVNDRKSGTFLNIAPDADPAIVTNNVFSGGGTPCNQASAVLSHNYTDAAPCLLDTVGFDYHLAPGSACVDGGIEPGDGDGFALAPSAHYAHPTTFLSRASVGNIDIGAYELGGEGEPAGGMSSGGGGSARGGAGGVGPGAPGTGGTLAGMHGGGQSDSAGSLNPNRAGASGADDTSTRDADCGCRLVAASNAERSRFGLASLLGLAAAAAVRRRR